MDRQLLKEYLERWQALEEIEKEENKRLSIEQRWNQLNAIYNLAVGLGLVFEDPRDHEDDVWMRWSKLKNEYDPA